MDVKLKAFGIAREILGSSNLTIQINHQTNVESLIERLKADFPPFSELTSIAIAVNASYAEPQQIIKAGDEVVIIPPVAGG